MMKEIKMKKQFKVKSIFNKKRKQKNEHRKKVSKSTTGERGDKNQ